jgi:imidazolonepropionase
MKGDTQMIADLIIHHIGELITPYHQPPIKGALMNDVLHIQNAYIAIKDGKIADFGSGSYAPRFGTRTRLVDAGGNIVVPGFIDGHTHLVFGGSREAEFAKKVAGVPYLEILKQGGGIFSTVVSTRKATFDELESQARKSLDRMLSFGVTALEAKSGYGLDIETEFKQLEVASWLQKTHSVEIVSTYMGAHAMPKEYQANREAYIVLMIDNMKMIKSRNLATFVDVFCEEGVFDSLETTRILAEANSIGLIPKMHADEIVPLGGAQIAVRAHASSADHLMAVDEEGVAMLAQSNTIANLLPGTSFYLDKPYANARKLIEAGAAVGIASDYNPGSSPSENFQFMMQLAAGKLKMTPDEVLTAVTINPAYSLGLAERMGSIALGKQADFVILDAKNLDYILYHYGINHAAAVYKNGVLAAIEGHTVQGGNI